VKVREPRQGAFDPAEAAIEGEWPCVNLRKNYSCRRGICLLSSRLASDCRAVELRTGFQKVLEVSSRMKHSTIEWWCESASKFMAILRRRSSRHRSAWKCVCFVLLRRRRPRHKPTVFG